MSKVLNFFGRDNDTFVVSGVREEDYEFTFDNDENEEGDIVLSVEANIGVLHVVATYDYHRSAGWLIGITQAWDSEDSAIPIPDWSISISPSADSESPVITIVAPDDVDVSVADNES